MLAYDSHRMGTPVELRVGGQSYRVLASADETELRRLAGIVDERLRALTGPGRQVSAQALVLAAISLAHDLEEERGLRRSSEERSKQALRSLLQRIDSVLDEPTTPAPAPTQVSAELSPSEP